MLAFLDVLSINQQHSEVSTMEYSGGFFIQTLQQQILVEARDVDVL